MYGYRPDDTLMSELERRGITASDIERVELRPDLGAPTETGVTVTLRSGRVESWRLTAATSRSRGA
jgi:hypothetical protein